MAKNKVSDYSSTAASNTDIGGIDIAEGCAPSGINNAIRELMSQVKDMQAGADGDNFVVGGNLSVTGTTTLTGILSATLSNTPAGNISATTVQAAINELDTEKAKIGANSDITSLSSLTTIPTIIETSISNSFPVGTIIDFAGATAPSGYILCNGASLLRTGTYANLFLAIGTLWGSVDSTHFTVPNFAAGMVSVQNSGTVGVSTTGQVISHSHTTAYTNGYDNSGPVYPTSGNIIRNGQINVASNTTGGTNNLAAGYAVLKCIKY